MGKGVVLFYLGDYMKSLSYFNRVLDQRPNDFAALGKGFVLFSLGDHVGALKSLDAAIASNTRDVHALYNKSSSLQKMGYYTQAIFY